MRGDIYSRLCSRRSTDDRFCDLVETHRASNANLKSSLATLLSFSTTAPLLDNTLLKRLGVTPGLQLEGTQYSQTNIHLCIFPLPLQNFKYKGSLLLCSVLFCSESPALQILCDPVQSVEMRSEVRDE